MDDNIGESIHIHIEDIRIDLTNSEFDRLFSDICSAVNEMIDIKGFDCRKINPSFLLDELWDNLRYLRAAKIDNALLREMICPFNGTYQKLPNSNAVQALKDNCDNHDGSILNRGDDQNQLNSMLQNIKSSGYPFNDQYIIMFGDDNTIRDGTYCAACLWHILGDVSVPVMRLYFDNQANINRKAESGHSKLCHKIRKRTDKLTVSRRFLQRTSYKIKKALYKSKAYRCYYTGKHKTENNEAQEIFNNK